MEWLHALALDMLRAQCMIHSLAEAEIQRRMTIILRQRHHGDKSLVVALEIGVMIFLTVLMVEKHIRVPFMV